MKSFIDYKNNTLDTGHPLMSLIIVNWNGKELLERCLNSILKNTVYPNYEIIVVDNGSTDGSTEIIEKKFPEVKLIKLEENVGFSKGNNIGIENANGEYLVLLNNDTEIITPNWLNIAVKIFKKNETAGVIGCKLFYPDGKIQQPSGGEINFLNPGVTRHIRVGKNPDREEYHIEKEADYVIGAAMFVKGELIKKIGNFDEIFSPAYYEEIDFCFRARKAGYRVIYTPDIEIIHYVHQTTKKLWRYNYMNYIVTRNELLFLLLNMPLKYFPIRIFYNIPLAIKAILKGRVYYFKAIFWNIKNLNIIIRKRIERNKNKKNLEVYYR